MVQHILSLWPYSGCTWWNAAGSKLCTSSATLHGAGVGAGTQSAAQPPLCQWQPGLHDSRVGLVHAPLHLQHGHPHDGGDVCAVGRRGPDLQQQQGLQHHRMGCRWVCRVAAGSRISTVTVASPLCVVCRCQSLHGVQCTASATVTCRFPGMCPAQNVDSRSSLPLLMEWALRHVYFSRNYGTSLSKATWRAPRIVCCCVACCLLQLKASWCAR